jgi:hypothetical protein
MLLNVRKAINVVMNREMGVENIHASHACACLLLNSSLCKKNTWAPQKKNANNVLINPYIV